MEHGDEMIDNVVHFKLPRPPRPIPYTTPIIGENQATNTFRSFQMDMLDPYFMHLSDNLTPFLVIVLIYNDFHLLKKIRVSRQIPNSPYEVISLINRARLLQYDDRDVIEKFSRI